MSSKENYNPMILSNVIGKKFKIDGFFSLRSEEIKTYENNNDYMTKPKNTNACSPISKNQLSANNHLVKSDCFKTKETILT